MQCPNCHQEVPDTAKVCGYCGHRLAAAPAPVQPVPPPVPPPVQAAPQPVYVAPPPPVSVPPRKRGIPGWVWGAIIAGVVLVVIVCVGLFLAKNYLPFQSLPVPVVSPSTATAEPTATRVPTLTTVQGNIGPSPTPTREPLEGENGQVPIVASTYLQDATLITYDNITSASDWSLSTGVSFPENGGPLVMAPPAGMAVEIIHNQQLNGNQAALITFYYVSAKPGFSCYIYAGAETDARFGILFMPDPYADVYKGGDLWYREQMNQAVQFSEWSYYQLLIAVMDKGDGYASFRVMAFPYGDPQHFDVWNLGGTNESNFVNQGWHFACQVMPDTQLDIFNYMLIGFSNFK